jgi:regulator of RNase E activity RraA
MPQLSDPVTRLRRLDACAASDALDKLQLSGAVGGLQQLASQRRIAGRVTTVKLATQAQVLASAAHSAAAPRHLCAAAIEASGPDSVIVVEQRTGIEAGSWGGLLTLGAKLRQVAGVISEGLVRDIDEARQYDFAVFARGLTARTARGRIAELGTHVDITVGDVTVRDGDYVIADNSGVVFMAAARIDEVLDVAEQIVAREAAMAKSLLNGQAITQVMGAHYEHMLKS